MRPFTLRSHVQIAMVVYVWFDVCQSYICNMVLEEGRCRAFGLSKQFSRIHFQAPVYNYGKAGGRGGGGAPLEKF